MALFMGKRYLKWASHMSFTQEVAYYTIKYNSCCGTLLKVARYSFPGPIPSKFEHKLRRHKQSFEKIGTTVVLDKDENLL